MSNTINSGQTANAGPVATAFSSSAAATLLLVMAWGAWQLVGAVRAGLEYPDSASDFREGRTTQTIEKQIDHKLPARASLIAVANSLRYRLVRGGGDQVRLGQDDWLYLTDELKFYPDGDAHQRTRLDLVAKVHQALNLQGVKLLVALVPDKARIYPQHLAAPFHGRMPGYTQARYTQALATLRAQGIVAPDLLAVMDRESSQNPLYYRTDTHWNNAGAALSARAIAAALGSSRPDLDITRFSTQATGAATDRPGDLIKLMGLAEVSNFWRPLPDVEAPVSTTQTSADKPAGGLLGDAAAPPVTLIGTSYSLRGNFHGYLQEALSAKVLNTAKDGGGFLQAATDYFKDEAFKTSPPRLVVWELPERFLQAPLEGKEADWLVQVGLGK